MSFKFRTMDDLEVEGKTVLVRVDINSPVDPQSGAILDDTRMRLHAETIRELSEGCQDSHNGPPEQARKEGLHNP